MRPARVAVRVAPVTYLPVVFWSGAVVARSAYPAHDVLVWQDRQTLSRGEDWTEFTLNAATVTKGTFAPGARVSVRYRTEGTTNIATAVTVAGKK